MTLETSPSVSFTNKDKNDTQKLTIKWKSNCFVADNKTLLSFVLFVHSFVLLLESTHAHNSNNIVYKYTNKNQHTLIQYKYTNTNVNENKLLKYIKIIISNL